MDERLGQDQHYSELAYSLLRVCIGCEFVVSSYTLGGAFSLKDGACKRVYVSVDVCACLLVHISFGLRVFALVYES